MIVLGPLIVWCQQARDNRETIPIKRDWLGISRLRKSYVSVDNTDLGLDDLSQPAASHIL
jgi:hypothetical protein